MQVPPGAYCGPIVEAGLRELPNEKRTVVFYITVELAYEESNGQWVPLDPAYGSPCLRDVEWFCSEKAWPHTVKRLERLGFNGDFKQPRFSPEHEESLVVQCRHETRDDRTYERFDTEPPAAEKSPPGEDVYRLLSARWGNNQAPARPAGPPPRAAPPPNRTTVRPARENVTEYQSSRPAPDMTDEPPF